MARLMTAGRELEGYKPAPLQWYRLKRCGPVEVWQAIPGAIGPNYTFVEADIGRALGWDQPRTGFASRRRFRGLSVRVRWPRVRPWWLSWSEWVWRAEHDRKGRWRRWYLALLLNRGRTDEGDLLDYEGWD